MCTPDADIERFTALLKRQACTTQGLAQVHDVSYVYSVPITRSRRANASGTSELTRNLAVR